MYNLLVCVRNGVSEYALYNPEGGCMTTFEGPLTTKEFVNKQVDKRGIKEFTEVSWEGPWPEVYPVVPQKSPKESKE